MLRGNIYITDDINVIYNAPYDSNTKIIDLDEDGVLENFQSSIVIKGTCILPPMDAKIAEVDGDEALYDQIYHHHLLAPHQQQYIAALISLLYRGGKLILFLPEVGYTHTQDKLIQHMFGSYYIHIGKIGDPNPAIANCYYNDMGIPVWLNMMYVAGTMDANEYLMNYPIDAVLNNNEVLNKLVNELRPYADSYNEQVYQIKKFHKLLHKKNGKLEQAIYLL